MNVADLMEANLDRDLLASLCIVGDCAEEHHAKAYLVGGPVRDLLLEYPSHNTDIAIEGDALGVAASIADRLGATVVRTHERFGTATLAMSNGHLIDLAMTRDETYAGPAALPDVQPASIRDDLSRRDFSVNALAADLSEKRFGEVLDVVGGMPDLDDSTLRALHQESFLDDPTRIFRAVRFEQRYGLKIDHATLLWLDLAVNTGAPAGLSGARVRQELYALLAEPDAAACLRRLRDTDILGALAMPLPFGRSAEERCVRAIGLCDEADGWTGPRRDVLVLVWLNTLPQDRVPLMADWLMLGSRLAKGAEVIAGHREHVAEALRQRASSSEWHALLRPFDSTSVMALAAELEDSDAVELLARWDAVESIQPFVTGNDLVAMGFQPGPAFAAALDDTLAEQLNGRIGNAFEAANFAREAMHRILNDGNDTPTA